VEQDRAASGTEYRESVKRNMPRTRFEKRPRNHVDAIGQGILFAMPWRRVGRDL
jgi:hypothetical protein